MVTHSSYLAIIYTQNEATLVATWHFHRVNWENYTFVSAASIFSINSKSSKVTNMFDMYMYTLMHPCSSRDYYDKHLMSSLNDLQTVNSNVHR